MRKWPLVRSARIARLCLQTAGGCSRAICELQDLFIARPTSRPLGLHAVHCYAGADGGSLHGYFEKAACAAVTSAAITDPARNALGCTTGWREGIHQPPHYKWYCLRVGLGFAPYAARSTDSRRVRAKRRRNSGRILTSRTSESLLLGQVEYTAKL